MKTSIILTSLLFTLVRVVAAPAPDIVIELPAGTVLSNNCAMPRVDLGLVPFGTNAQRTFIIRNIGDAALSNVWMNIDSTTLDPFDEFQIEPNPAGTVPAGSNTTFTVAFTPIYHTNAGTAVLSIFSDDPDEPLIDITLTANQTITRPLDWTARIDLPPYRSESLALSGDTLVVGNWSTSGSLEGAAYVFVPDGTCGNWVLRDTLLPPIPNSFEFGYSVAISGDTIAVGRYGYVFVFARNGTNWTWQPVINISPDHFISYSAFGMKVALSGDTLVVGAPNDWSDATGVNGSPSNTNSVSYSGAAYVFGRTGTNWIQQAYLKASNAGAGDQFGISLAVSGDTVVVGASYEASNATGINGNQADNSAPVSGAAYIFVRDGTNWTQQAYLKASNAERGVDPCLPGNNAGCQNVLDRVGEHFGASVAISGDTVVVAAPREDSNALGVNGNQSDNGATNSGAAYVFVRSGTNWSQQAYLKASRREPGIAEYPELDYPSVAISGDTVVATFSWGIEAYVRCGTNWFERATLRPSLTETNPLPVISVALSGDTAVAVVSEVAAVYEPSGRAAYVFSGLGLDSCLHASPRLSLAPDGRGGYFLRFTGAPDVTYRMLRAPSPTGPWDTTLATLTAPASGQLEYHDTTPPPAQAFYRAAQP